MIERSCVIWVASVCFLSGNPEVTTLNARTQRYLYSKSLTLGDISGGCFYPRAFNPRSTLWGSHHHQPVFISHSWTWVYPVRMRGVWAQSTTLAECGLAGFSNLWEHYGELLGMQGSNDVFFTAKQVIFSIRNVRGECPGFELPTPWPGRGLNQASFMFTISRSLTSRYASTKNTIHGHTSTTSNKHQTYNIKVLPGHIALTICIRKLQNLQTHFVESTFSNAALLFSNASFILVVQGSR